MFTLELKNNWQEKAEEKIVYQEADSTEEKEDSIIYKIET